MVATIFFIAEGGLELTGWPVVADLGIPHRVMELRWRKLAVVVFNLERRGSCPGSLWSLRRLSRGQR
jgi:hypothetical protein